MSKKIFIAAGLGILAFSTAPLAAQDTSATRCQSSTEGVDAVRTAREKGSGASNPHVKVFSGTTTDAQATTAGGATVATGDVNGDGATSGSSLPNAKLSARKMGGDGGTYGAVQQNNMKQIGLANSCN